MSAKNESLLIKGRRIYEDDGFVLLWSKGPFGITHPIFSTFYVYAKEREIAVKASGREKAFLLAVIAEYQNLGLDPPQLTRTDLYRNFANAVAARGFAQWKVFFGQNAKQLARQYAQSH